VNRRRRQAILVAGLASGLGGGYLLLGQVGRFEPGIVAGRGFIALAAVIFGGWTLRGALAGCLLFGSVLSFRLTLPGLGYKLNNEMLSSLPFLVTIIGMALFAHVVRQPAALARPFIRGLK
jgi:simple sugar transport system permease protein